ncbi:MAG: PadR family transcriptional regulator [Clostridia bacterium]|nr:PadR family transcriptional regulator [Clostridia bacterium]
MLSSDVMRGYNDTLILSLLAEGDSYGYEISRNIQERTGGAYAMRETTLYSAFNRLERLGYVSSYQGTETFGRKRTYYTITPAGLVFYHKKCEEWILLQQVINRFLKE